jgi:hypothetical protein
LENCKKYFITFGQRTEAEKPSGGGVIATHRVYRPFTSSKGREK